MRDAGNIRPTAIKIYQFQGHRDSIYHLESLGDGKSFCSSGAEGLVVTWSVDEPDQGHLLARVNGSVYCMAYSRKSDLLLVGQNNSGLHAIHVRQKKLVMSAALGEVAIFSIVINGDKVFLGTGEGELVILSLENLKILDRIKLSSKSLRTISMNPNTGHLALGFSDFHIRYFDPESMSLICDWEAHQGSVFTLQFSPDGRYLLSGSRDARINRWLVQKDFEPAGTVAAHLFAINHIAYSPDGEHFLTCSMDKTIKIWSSDDLSLLRVLDRARHAGHGNSVNKLSWLKEDLFISAGDDRIISVWKFHKTLPQ